MILTKIHIQNLIDTKQLRIEPKPEIKESSIKIHISDTYALKPHEFILAKTLENILMPKHIAALYDGYTHMARKGVMTHLGSMFVEPESDGQLTLEIYNASSQEVVLEKGMRVGQLILLEVKPN
jgi:deoxycytidine triphosphate deaminase